MRVNKGKTRPDVGASERAEVGIASQCSFPDFDFTSPVPRGQWQIADLLPRGQANAVPLRLLVSMTGLAGRKIRLMIARERMEGVPIVSDNANGYFIAETQTEREAFCRSMRHRAAEIIKIAENWRIWTDEKRARFE